ncbi:MAG: hypothetical protein WD060_04925 [Pirellulales bacterium]
MPWASWRMNSPVAATEFLRRASEATPPAALYAAREAAAVPLVDWSTDTSR